MNKKAKLELLPSLLQAVGNTSLFPTAETILNHFKNNIACVRTAGINRIKLLKQLEQTTNEAIDSFFNTNYKQNENEKDGENRIVTYRNAMLTNSFAGVQEFSEEFFDVLKLASARQRLGREVVQRALTTLSDEEHGFLLFEKTMLVNAAKVSNHFDDYYHAWAHAVQGNETASELANNPPSVDSPLYNNHYTILTLQKSSHSSTSSQQQVSYTETPYGVYFEKQLIPIVSAMKDWVSELKQLDSKGLLKTSDEKRYISYIEQYALCLGEKDASKLESSWKELDRIWMDIKSDLQIVHCMEYGYGDPLRIKVIPDFSIRLKDEEYKEGNIIIGKIQDEMVKYYSARTNKSDLAKKGLFALQNSMAGIYYLPFQCGMSLHFRFSGQSIPNRAEVKDEKGVKIYFDPVSTANRQEATKKLMEKVFSSDTCTMLSQRLTPVDTLVYHVAAHEIGHAIYGLDHVRGCIKAATKTLLEEPRAELTSLHTMLLLYKIGFIDAGECLKHLSTFAVQDLRRYATFDSISTRPYTISALNTYKTYEKYGYLTLNATKTSLILDESKAERVLEHFSKQFESVLDAEDARDGAKLESVLDDMQVENDLTKWLVAHLNKH